MAPLVFSSRLATSLNFFSIIEAFKPEPSRNWSASTAIASPVTSSRASQAIHLQAPTSPSTIGKSIALEAASKVSARAAWQPPKYVYPDPNPEFARAETERFQVELMKRLSKYKEIFGEDVKEVASVCAEIFSNFLHKEYGGPGTLLVEPFTDMLLALKAKKLPGPPVAARAALLWAQNHVDRDWETWNAQTSQ